jgi:hypothetical protein
MKSNTVKLQKRTMKQMNVRGEEKNCSRGTKPHVQIDYYARQQWQVWVGLVVTDGHAIQAAVFSLICTTAISLCSLLSFFSFVSRYVFAG